VDARIVDIFISLTWRSLFIGFGIFHIVAAIKDIEWYIDNAIRGARGGHPVGRMFTRILVGLSGIIPIIFALAW
jgi:hypothetical protein